MYLYTLYYHIYPHKYRYITNILHPILLFLNKLLVIFISPLSLLADFSSLSLEDVDSVSEADRDTLAPLPPPTWNNQYPYSSSSYLPQNLSYVPPYCYTNTDTTSYVGSFVDGCGAPPSATGGVGSGGVGGGGGGGGGGNGSAGSVHSGSGKNLFCRKYVVDLFVINADQFYLWPLFFLLPYPHFLFLFSLSPLSV